VLGQAGKYPAALIVLIGKDLKSTLRAQPEKMLAALMPRSASCLPAIKLVRKTLRRSRRTSLIMKRVRRHRLAAGRILDRECEMTPTLKVKRP